MARELRRFAGPIGERMLAGISRTAEPRYWRRATGARCPSRASHAVSLRQQEGRSATEEAAESEAARAGRSRRPWLFGLVGRIGGASDRQPSPVRNPPVMSRRGPAAPSRWTDRRAHHRPEAGRRMRRPAFGTRSSSRGPRAHSRRLSFGSHSSPWKPQTGPSVGSHRFLGPSATSRHRTAPKRHRATKRGIDARDSRPYSLSAISG